MRRLRTILPLLATVALLVGAAGCTSDGDDSASTTTRRATTSTTEVDDPTTTRSDDGTTSTTEPTATTTTTRDDAGGDPDDADRQAYLDGLQASFDDFLATPGVEADPAAFTCLGEIWVDTLGVDRLVEAGITPEKFATAIPDQMGTLELDEATAVELFDAYRDCGLDLRELYGIDDPSLSAAEQACLKDAFSDENLRAQFVAAATGQPAPAGTNENPLDCLETTDPATAPSPGG